jgi:hypothetical protein
MDDKRKKQEELLTELESIKDLLDSDFLDDDTFTDPRAQRAASNQDTLYKNSDIPIEIPVLNEMVIEDELLTKELHQSQIEGPITAENTVQQNDIESTLKSAPTKGSIQDNLAPQNITPNNVLPGQQSLFDKARLKKEKAAVQKAESELTNLDQKPTNTNHTVQEETDDNVTENPFLPQHIRERLTKPEDLEAILASNIQKRFLLPPIVKTTVEDDSIYQPRFFSTNSFVDSIEQDSSKAQSLEAALNQAPSYKDSLSSTFKSEAKSETRSAPKSASDEKIDLLIDGLIAQYLPEIEAKLRFQLKQALIKKPQKK